MSRQRVAPFAAACPECAVESEAESANELVEFYRRHHRHTGHEIAWTRADVGFDLPDGDLEAVVGECESHYDEGVPIGIVAAAMGARGLTVGETLARIREVRMTGALYEPRDDHIAKV
ncbi:hypothetical protein [Halegenticoccus tardaugens]|uniref:hypothetical protein n=1 Tax=Halegenticoccus tardaugens TaxID=2071624 RepID=UPI00100ADB92|nr:hypothetical protein [Halegenticoccus tardaugens]